MQNKHFLFSLFLVLLIFSGCSNKTVYNQQSGRWLDTETIANQIDKDLNFDEVDNTSTERFKAKKIAQFEEWTEELYDSIETRKNETSRFSMGNKKVRDAVLYKIN